MTEAKKFKKPNFLSEKQFSEHIKLYEGYVKKGDEISEKLRSSNSEDNNATFSETRSLRTAGTFAANGIKLHEAYFGNLGVSKLNGEIKKAIEKKWNNLDAFKKKFIAAALSVRGWVVLIWDYEFKKIRIYATDQHDIAIWNALPLLVLDVYEHAYFMDYGTNRKQYAEDFFSNIDWNEVNKRLKSIK